jgi:ABC-type sugar transport system ATPase subunit
MAAGDDAITAAIAFADVGKSFRRPHSDRLEVVLRSFNLSIAIGELVALVGLSGLRAPSFGERIAILSRTRASFARRRAAIPRQQRLYPSLTVGDSALPPSAGPNSLATAARSILRSSAARLGPKVVSNRD